MSKKISELSDASVIDGTEQIELVQYGANVKATINDLLPVQLQEGKEIDLNGFPLNIEYNDLYFLKLDPTVNDDQNASAIVSASFGTDISAAAFILIPNGAQAQLYAALNNIAKTAMIQALVTGDGMGSYDSSLNYNADNHIFSDLIARDFVNDAAAAAATPAVPVGGLYHTSGTLKIRLS